MMKNIAIVVVAYNRIESLSKLLLSLSCADYPQSVPLIISIDKSETDMVEKFADSFIWSHGEKIIVKHQYNMGLRNHIISVGDYTRTYDAVVVLEDDLEVSPGFFYFVLECVEKYHLNDKIAGISLYNFMTNLQTNLPFIPEKNEFDAFLFQNAQSWGQVWMKKQWKEFACWYSQNNEDFVDSPHLPKSICSWPKSSWLKYHIKYCIEKEKYFVYPYCSLTFCSGEVGVHSKVMNVFPHCPTQSGIKKNYNLPDFGCAVKYDAFYENESLLDSLRMADVCIDLNGSKRSLMGKQYWLTTKLAPYKVVFSYGLMYYPIEINVKKCTVGDGIFLYDTHQKAKPPHNNIAKLIDYNFKVKGLLKFCYSKGIFKTMLSVVKYIFQ